MNPLNNGIITTDCGKEFELNNLETIRTGSLNSNENYTYTIYKTPSQEFIQKKSFFNPTMNHRSTNYELISESVVKNITSTF